MKICNCHTDVFEYLAGVPSDWRDAITKALCFTLNEPLFACEDIKKCETRTSLSPFSADGTKVSFVYTDEKKVARTRTLDLSDAVEDVFDSIDPKCLMSQEDWEELSPTEKLQAILAAFCQCCTTTTTTTTSTTTTSTSTSTTTTTTSALDYFLADAYECVNGSCVQIGTGVPVEVPHGFTPASGFYYPGDDDVLYHLFVKVPFPGGTPESIDTDNGSASCNSFCPTTTTSTSTTTTTTCCPITDAEIEEVTTTTTSTTTTTTIAFCNDPENLTFNLVEDITPLMYHASWDAVPGAVSYSWELYEGPTVSGSPVLTGTAGTNSVDLQPLEFDTIYTFRVRTNCASGVSAWVVDTFDTNCTRPSGLTRASLVASWDSTNPSFPHSRPYNFSGDVPTACAAFQEFQGYEGSFVNTLGWYAVEAEDYNIGTYLYNFNNAPDCSTIPDGSYWFTTDTTSLTTYFWAQSSIQIVTVVDGFITAIDTCNVPATTTTTTTTSTTTTTTAAPTTTTTTSTTTTTTAAPTTTTTTTSTTTTSTSTTTTTTAAPMAPIADAGTDQSLWVTTTQLYGDGSYDPDGVITDYLWTFISGPATPTITNETTSIANVSGMSAVGVYTFQLQITDNLGMTDTDTISVEVFNDQPLYRIGYVKSSGGFSLDGAEGMSGINVEVWGYRSLGELSIGDVLYTDSTGATPFDGGALAYGFSTENGGDNNPRGIKINLDGTILDIRTYIWGVNGYCKLNGDCGDSDVDTPIYGAIDDPSFYSNKLIYQNSFGSLMASGDYCFSYEINTPASFTFTVASAWPVTGQLINGQSCGAAPQYAPIVYVGEDTSIPLPTDSIFLSGLPSSDFDGPFGPDTKSSYQWHYVSGPLGATFTTPDQITTTVENLVEGTYVFRLVVYDWSGYHGTDDIEVTVFTPLCDTPTLIPIEAQDVYDLIGGDEAAGNKAIYMFDPADTTKSSQYVTKYADFVRWKDADDEDVGRVYIINFQTPYNITEIRANMANCTGGRMHLSFGHKVVEPEMIIRAYDDDPDMTFSLPAGSTDEVLAENLQVTTQYIYLRLHDNDDIRNLRFYGCPSDDPAETTFNHTSIPSKDHTMQQVDELQGFNLLAVLVDPLERARWADNGVFRAYDAGTLWNPDTSTLYQGDKDNVAWNIGGVNTNKFYLNIYNTPYSTRDFNLDMAAQGNRQLLTLRGANGYYRNQLHVAGDDSFNVRSLNQMGDNPRDPESYDRFAWYCGMWAHFFGSNTSSPTTDVRFDAGSYGDSSSPGQGYLKYIAPGNELDGWFFQGRVHSPIEIAAIMTRTYPKIKFYDPDLPVLLQAVVTHNWTFQRTTILCCKIFAQSTDLPFDKIEVHATKSTKDFPHIPTTDEMIGMHGAVPESRNTTGSFTSLSEYEKIRVNKELIWEEMGYEPDIIISEWAYNTNLTNLAPPDGASVAGVSTIAAPDINSYDRFESHGICVLRYFLQIAQAGVFGSNWYEAYDNQVTSGIYYDAPDQSNGLVFNPNAVPGTDEVGNKPAYYMWFGFCDKLADYRFDDVPVVAGVSDKWVYRLSHITDPLKKAYVVVYGAEDDLITPLTYNIDPPETSSFTVQQWTPSLTNLTGTSGAPDTRSTPLTVNVTVYPQVYMVDLIMP